VTERRREYKENAGTSSHASGSSSSQIRLAPNHCPALVEEVLHIS
jgi:hypothetical protein